MRSASRKSTCDTTCDATCETAISRGMCPMRRPTRVSSRNVEGLLQYDVAATAAGGERKLVSGCSQPGQRKCQRQHHCDLLKHVKPPGMWVEGTSLLRREYWDYRVS